MVAVAVVEVAVEGLLLGQALRGVGADGGAHVAEHRRGFAAGFARAGMDVLARAGRELGRHPVEEGPVEGAPASAHIFGPIAASTSRTPGIASRNAPAAPRASR